MNTMTAVQLTNMQVLIAHADRMNRPLIMDRYVQGCGTPACMFGEMASMPHFNAQGLTIGEYAVYFRNEGASHYEHVYLLLGLTYEETVQLFGSDSINAWKGREPSGQEWAAEARRILAAHGYPAAPSEPDRIEEPSPHLTALLQRLTAPVRVRG